MVVITNLLGEDQAVHQDIPWKQTARPALSGYCFSSLNISIFWYIVEGFLMQIFHPMSYLFDHKLSTSNKDVFLSALIKKSSHFS